METVKKKALDILCITTFFLGGIWIMFFINNILFQSTLSFGVHPRTVGIKEFLGMNFSWIFHANLNHITGNSLALITMIPMIAAFERRPWLVLWLLIFVSGFMTWCLGSSNSNHIGASGLIFAIMGYIFTVAIFAKKYQYWIPILLSGSSYWFSIKTGLIPQSGVSFAGHFGGLIGGIILGIWMAYESKKDIYTKPSIIRFTSSKPTAWQSIYKNNTSKKWNRWKK